MLDEVRKGDWAPRSVHRKSRKVAEAIKAIEARTGQDAKDGQVAKEMNIDLNAYYAILQDASRSILQNRVVGIEINIHLFGYLTIFGILSGASLDCLDCFRYFTRFAMHRARSPISLPYLVQHRAAARCWTR